MIDRCRSVYCEACCATDANWLALAWADRSVAELELDEVLAPPLPPMLTKPQVDAAAARALALWVWLFSTWTSALESLAVCCW